MNNVLNKSMVINNPYGVVEDILCDTVVTAGTSGMIVYLETTS